MIEQNLLINKQLDQLINGNLFTDAADLLFKSQLNEWQLMQENYFALKGVKEKSFWFDGFKYNVQFNPKRIKSTSADVGEEIIKSRLCFLCVENLPSQQKGVLLNEKYVLLCNPYPIFQQHFTVSLLKHRGQNIKNSIKDFLEITKQLSKKYTLIYNGPECGASAPDHLHFQALTKNLMPIENDIYQLKNDCGENIFTDEQTRVTSINDELRTLIFIEALELRSAVKFFENFYKYYSKHLLSSSEPLMNLICDYDEEFGFGLIIFLRSKHRPENYFAKEPNKLMISPAAVDLGGTLIAPREEDFNRLNKGLIQKILSEVSLDSDSFRKITKFLRVKL
ncbi:MAG: DUF4922 domain-containing protein [Ignavibacteria bacterium]|nr:DUF4922 domain-containing protein [Ignavibacteria bacterium]